MGILIRWTVVVLAVLASGADVMAQEQGRKPVAVVLSEELPDDRSYRVERRVAHSPSDVIHLSPGASDSVLSEAIWALLETWDRDGVEPSTPASFTGDRIDPVPAVVLPWAARVVTDLQGAQVVGIDGVGYVQAKIIFLPRDPALRQWWQRSGEGPVGTPVRMPGQASGPDSVSLEFVEVLSGAPFSGGDFPGVLVGVLPEELAGRLPLPADGRVVGSLLHGPYSVSAVAVPGGRAAVRDEWAERLIGDGWTRVEPPARSGFQSSPVEGLRFCLGDSEAVTLDVSENPRGGSYVLVISHTSRMNSICRYPEPAPRWDDSLIPSLASPAGAIALGSGAGGGGDEWYANARIRTDLSMGELVDHYGAQLREHGWALRGRTIGAGLAGEVYRVTDPEGAAWHGLLVVSTPAGASDQFLSLRVTPVERRY